MRARLINPRRVTIQPIDRAGTVRDDLAGEPIGRIARSANVQLLAQFDELGNNMRRPGPGGPQVDAVGALTFRRADLVRLGYQPADGDLLIEVADRRGNNGRTVRLYLQGPTDHGEEHHGPKLVTCALATRTAARAKVEGVGIP